MSFNADLGLNRGDSWLGWPKGASPSRDLIGSSRIGAKNGGGRGILRREKEKENQFFSNFWIFLNPNL